MSKYLSRKYSELVPYTPGEQPQDMKYVKLNTNESPFPPSPKVIEAMNSELANRLRLYPDPTSRASADAIAEYYGVESRNVFVGNGSDEVLAMAFQAFFDENTSVAIPDISYGFYPVYSKLFAVAPRVIPLRKDMSMDLEAFAACDEAVLFANPNAPTGMAVSREDVRKLLESKSERLVIVDEAYVDFGAESCVELTKSYDNLLVIGTLSKSRSLAGARVGFAIGNAAIIGDLNTIKYSFNSYNVNAISNRLAAEAIKDVEYFESTRKVIMENRAYLTAELARLGFDTLPSAANFVFTQPKGVTAREYYQKLKAMGVLIRYFDLPRISDYVRITIGSREELDILLKCTKQLLSASKEE